MNKETKRNIDWTAFDAVDEQSRHAAAMSDPDAKPITPGNLGALRRRPQAGVVRRALGLTQEEFANRFHIPVGTLRDWEQGRKEPDAAAAAYLRVIARHPETVAQALAE